MYSNLVRIADEAAGSNSKRIRTGLDNDEDGGTARDGILQNGEADSTEYAYNWEDRTTNKITKTLACTGSISTIP